MVINHLLTGMILQVTPFKGWNFRVGPPMERNLYFLHVQLLRFYTHPVIPNVRIGGVKDPQSSPEVKGFRGSKTSILTFGMTGGFWMSRVSPFLLKLQRLLKMK